MEIKTSSFIPGRRQFISKVLPAGALLCLGCRGLSALSYINTTKTSQDQKPKYLEDSGMNVLDVFKLSYGASIPVYQALAKKIGKEKLLTMLTEANAEVFSHMFACTITDTLIEFASYGVYCEECTGDVTVSGCTMRKCDLCVYLYDSSGTCLIEDNVITESDVGIICDSQTAPTQITGNTVTCVSWEGWCGIACWESSATISSNSVSGFYTGVDCEYYSSPDITSNTIQNNYYGIYCDYDTLPLVHNNNIEGNYSYGLYHEVSSGTVDAENNWWGDASGPYHPTDNPGGLGDEVSDYVDFDPWLTSAVTLASLMIQP